ncbi:sulfatase-like hydrolase/transferase [Photobacterium carnosum]|uniref:sulfatase-like hydrolase/transferase n=1 Tax=Photobacterium carnosum TaxID=2023717 RepID=UPI001E35C8AF|nr:sulfatase-like hydrolase/transferase [Photobacterium carnosum]
MKISRRSFIQAASAVGAMTALNSVAGPMTAKGEKPNVLFIAVDDLNDWLGCLKGHPQAKTPNLDRLLRSSTNFVNAHCPVPVCGPSRNALLTGMRPSTTGWYSNRELGMKNFPEIAEQVLGDIPTLPQHFKNNGYYTMVVGKISHHGLYDYRKDEQWSELAPKWVLAGDDRKFLERGQGYGDYGENDHKYYPFPAEGSQTFPMFGKKGLSLCAGPLDRDDIANGGIMPDEMFAQWAVDKLKQDYDKPFFLGCGFVRPHVPYTAPREYFERFPLDEIILPEYLENDMDDIPLYGKLMTHGFINGGDHAAVQAIGMKFQKELIQGYLACVAFVDDQIGKVVNALENSKHQDNTIVVLWGDHGQNLGEHTSWRKMTLWEESTRVPLAIRLPKQAKGQETQQAVNLLDLYPTLTELCGLPHVKSNEGISLNALINNPNFDRKFPSITTWGYKNHAVCDEQYRYIRYRDDSEELYDHKTDPHEHHNLANKFEYYQVKVDLAKWIPQNQVFPTGMTDFSKGDWLEATKTRWEKEGVPEHLK